MTLGFKTGPLNWEEGQQLVTKHGATMCEVWFRIDRAPEFVPMVAWLREHDVAVGLHYWGVLTGGYKPNTMTNQETIRDETLRQMLDTIALAKEYECVYVNIHPGARAVEHMDLDNRTQSLTDLPVTPALEARELLHDAVAQLHQAAAQAGALLTVETVPPVEQFTVGEREPTYDPGSATIDDMRSLAEAGYHVANDISHTACCAPVQEPEPMWDEVVAFAKDTSTQTRLVHLNTMSAPFNGTDSHDGVTPEDFARGVVPTKEQIQNLLTLYHEVEPLYVVPEPHDHMTENYLALRDLAQG